MSEETGGASTVTSSRSSSRPSATCTKAQRREILEVSLRAAAVISSLAALISAAVAVGTFNDLDESGSVVKKVRAASGWIIFIAVVAMTIEIVSTILRLLDPEGKKSKLSYILGDYDVVISVLLALGFVAGGVAAAVFAADFEKGTVLSTLAAAAAFSFFSVIMFVVLAVLSAYGLLIK